MAEQSSSVFVTHARTIEELRDEFVSDIHSRLARLDIEAKHEKRVGHQRAIVRAKMELEGVMAYWQTVELRGMKPTKPVIRNDGVINFGGNDARGSKP